MTQPPVFREIQRMRQPWIWLLLGVIGGITLIAGSVGGLVTVLFVVALFFTIRLTTEVREDGVYVRFAPFHRSFRHISFSEIERVETAEFGLLTYGGIGIRWTPNAIAYMTNRGEGVKIHRRAGKSVVIGSRDAEELMETIDERL